MVDDLEFQDVSDLGIVSIEFGRESAYAVDRAVFGDSNLIARWDRIREEVSFPDLIASEEGTREQKISCPFHGRDRNPSFQIYRRSNDAYCYGCPEGSKLYDSVRFIKAKYGLSALQAIVWLEKHFGLPPLEGDEDLDDDDEDSDEKTVSIGFADMAEPYRQHAAAAFLADPDPEMAREYIEIYFDALPDKKEDPESPEELLKAVSLARVLGSAAIEAIKKKRFGA